MFSLIFLKIYGRAAALQAYRRAASSKYVHSTTALIET
jgi:hypothetical protein